MYRLKTLLLFAAVEQAPERTSHYLLPSLVLPLNETNLEGKTTAG